MALQLPGKRRTLSDITPQEPDDSRITRTETCTLSAVRRVAAMLDQDPDVWREGDVLPRGWQFILLGADTRRSALRRDGFPGLGVPIPDLGLPRLMLGGRTVRFAGDIPVGATLRRESRLQKLSRKETANGPIAIVTLAHDLFLPDMELPILSETQTYLLLGPQPSSQRPAPTVRELPMSARSKTVTPDDTLLFQYSALGFNSHRIHIDRAFARDTEGFPDLVVNGGLATLLLTEFLREQGVVPVGLSARHLVPLFCGRPVLLGLDEHEGRTTLRAFDDAGQAAVEIEVQRT